MYGAVVERGIIRAADQKKYIVETLDRKGIESLQITALNGAPFAVGDIVYFFLFPDGTGKIICSEAANDTTGFVVDANYVHTDNNYTDDEKAKLSDIEAEAQKNVQSDWKAESGDAFIKNRPTIPTKVSELENDSGFVNSAEAAAAAPVRSVNGHTGDVDIPTVNLPVSVQDGGTGADNAADARTNLGLGDVATENVVPLNKGGTGATTAAAARENLAVLPLAGGTVTGQVKSTYANPDGFLVEHGAADKDACFRATRSDTGVSVIMGVGSGGINHGVYSYKLGKWLIYGDGSNVHCNGTATNVTGTVAIDHGGTGATTAAAARTNLAVPNMQTDTYPTLLEPDGGNSWIKIGKANSSFGLLPSQGGTKGSGHNHLGTSSWYWSDAYVDNYYGSWKGDTIPVDKGGTGATTAAAARTNLGAIAMPTVIVKNSTTTSTEADATYTVSGSGVVIVFAGMLSDDSSDYGTFQSRIYYDGSSIMGEGTRWGSALNYALGASTAVPIAVSNGKKIRIFLRNTKNGTKYIYRRFLCFGCTVS